MRSEKGLGVFPGFFTCFRAGDGGAIFVDTLDVFLERKTLLSSKKGDVSFDQGFVGG